MWTFRLSLNPSLNQMRKLHYQAYARLRRQYAREIWAQLPHKEDPPTPLPRAALEFRRHSSGVLDWDNALAGVKPIIDCLLPATQRHPDGLGLLQDDSPAVLVYPPRLVQLPAPRGKGWLELRISDTPEIFEEFFEAPLVKIWETDQMPPSLNNLRNCHFQTYKTIRQGWGNFFGPAEGPALGKAWLALETWRLQWVDWDNFFGGLKPLLDCLSRPGARNPDGQGWIGDDHPRILAQPKLSQRLVQHRSEIRTKFHLYGFQM